MTHAKAFGRHAALLLDEHLPSFTPPYLLYITRTAPRA
jgi:hypothetical protein